MADVGRPKIFETPEQMQKAINAYFADREDRGLPLTIESLAVALNMSRNTLMTYEKENSHAEFNDTVKKAKDVVLSNLMDKALIGDINPAVSIFNLKNNYNYVDKVEQEVTSNNITTVVFDRTEGIPTKFAHTEDEIED